MKSSVDEIRRRFDADVERFSNLETGQSATVDAPLAMALVAQAAAATTPHAKHVLDRTSASRRSGPCPENDADPLLPTRSGTGDAGEEGDG
jgi:hypothetical protein